MSKGFYIAFAAILLAAIVGGVMLNSGDSESDSTLSDAARFKKEYQLVSDDNPFVYTNGDDTVEILESGTGVVLLGFKECPWCQQIAPRLEKAAKAEGLEKINYLDIRKLRADNDEVYKKLVAILKEHLEKDENGEPRIFVPDVTVVRNGEIIGRYEQEPTAEGEQVTPESYWTEERSERAVASLRDMISKMQE